MAMNVSDSKDNLQSGSEEIKEVYCDHCRITGQSISSTSYCPTCEECLCSSCSLMHTGAKLTKHHALQDVQITFSQSSVSIPSWQECPEHSGKAIRLFCNSHNALCCTICLNRYHKTCQNTVLISELANDVCESEQFKLFKTNLKGEIDKSRKDKNFKWNKKKIEAEFCRALKDIDDLAEMAHLRIDKLKENTIKVAKQIMAENTSKLKRMDEGMRRFKTDIQCILTDIDRAERKRQLERLFIAWKYSQCKLEDAKYNISQLVENNSIKSMRLDHTEEIETILGAKSVLGTFTESHLAMTYVGEINVKSLDDKEDCGIDGITLLPSNRMIVSDYTNSKIKIVNLEDNTIVYERMFPEYPSDVTTLDNNKIAVAFADNKTISMLSADDSLEFDYDIKVDSDCLSVVQEQHHGQLIVSYSKKVQILDLSGKVIREFITDTSGNPLFNKPRHIALSPDHSMIYVSDFANDTVTCLTLDGEVKAVYRDVDLRNPHGIVVVEDGRVLVGSGDTHTIHVLSSDLIKLMVIPVDQNKVIFFYAFAFCPTIKMLYISCASALQSHRNFIKMFKLQ